MIDEEARPLHGTLTVVTGGARSGKSAYAEGLAMAYGKEVLYVATAEALDDDMLKRIADHRAARPAEWQTIEVPLGVARALIARGRGPRVVLLDCMTLLVSNLLLRELPIRDEIDSLLQWHSTAGQDLIVVTNEVGLGIVPDNALARRYRDELGRANQRLAEAADSVVFMVSGLALAIKAPIA